MLPCLFHFVMPLPFAGAIPRWHKIIHVQYIVFCSFSWSSTVLVFIQTNSCEVAQHMAEFMPEFNTLGLHLDLNCKGEISSYSLLGAEHQNKTNYVWTTRRGRTGTMELETKKTGEMGGGEFPFFLGCFWCWWALAVMEVGMKMENTWILGIVKFTVLVIASAMAVNHHRVLYLTLALSKSGILVLSCPHNVLTFCFWQLHFPAPYQISLSPWEWYHILLNTLKARPLICQTHFIFLAVLQKT